jgi:SAM-dependent methyltransferase
MASLGVAEAGALTASLLIAVAGAALHERPWRRAVVALGWPLALSLSAVAVPAWAWALAAGLLLLLYPRRLWRDAPLFPTPLGALDALAQHAPLPPNARVLDAGCGAGHGLRALARAYPAARLEGVEASRLLALWARWRCPRATVRCGDLWHESWAGLSLVYLFQRPESMPDALAKARAELGPGAWLVSLDFPLPGVRAARQWPHGRHTVYLYPAESLN